MTLLEILKSNSGSITGVATSKKYGLTVAFASACLGLLAATGSTLVQVALLASATVSIVAYVASQAFVEAHAAGVASNPEDKAPPAAVSSASPE